MSMIFFAMHTFSSKQHLYVTVKAHKYDQIFIVPVAL